MTTLMLLMLDVDTPVHGQILASFVGIMKPKPFSGGTERRNYLCVSLLKQATLITFVQSALTDKRYPIMLWMLSWITFQTLFMNGSSKEQMTGPNSVKLRAHFIIQQKE